jgi:hypothetical protein
LTTCGSTNKKYLRAQEQSFFLEFQILTYINVFLICNNGKFYNNNDVFEPIEAQCNETPEIKVMHTHFFVEKQIVDSQNISSQIENTKILPIL